MQLKLFFLTILFTIGMCGAVANDNVPIWTNLNISDTTQMAIIDDYLFVMNNDNMIYKLSSYSGTVVDSTSYFDGATDYVFESNLAISPDQSTLYVSDDMDVYAFNTSDLEIKWTSTSYSAAQNGLLVDAEGYIYFVDYGSKAIVKLDPDTGSVEDSLIFVETPQGYPAISPDGDLIAMQFNDGNFIKSKMIYTNNLTIAVNGSSNLGSPSDIKCTNTFITPTTAIVYSADTIYKFTSAGTVTAIADENIYNEAETNDYSGAVIDGDNNLYTVSTYNSTGFIVNAYSHSEGVYTFDWASNQIDLIDDYLVFSYGEPLASVDNMIYINAIAGNEGTGDTIAAHICVDGTDGSVEWINTDLTAKSIDYDTIQQAMFGSALGINMVYMATTDGIYAYDTSYQPTHKPDDVFSEITFYTSNTRTSAYQQSGNSAPTVDDDEPVLLGGGGGGSGGSSSKKVTTTEEDDSNVTSVSSNNHISNSSIILEEMPTTTLMLVLSAYLGVYTISRNRKEKDLNSTIMYGSLITAIGLIIMYIGYNPYILNWLFSTESIIVAIITFYIYGLIVGSAFINKNIKRRVR
jgi:hypothetical protein